MRLVKRGLRRLGFEIRRTGRAWGGTPGRATAEASLSQLRTAGLDPATVIDVGVAYGTPDLYEAFPAARLMLVEPLVEWEDGLRKLAEARSANYVLAAAGDHEGETELTVPDVLSWASGAEWSSVSGASTALERGLIGASRRRVPLVTLDSLVDRYGLKPPYVLKVDVEGAEASVLRGARRVLSDCEAVVVETALDADFFGVIETLTLAGFVPHDIVAPNYRISDDALVQVDMVFVRRDGPFRKGGYCSPDQDERFEAIVRKHLDANPGR